MFAAKLECQAFVHRMQEKRACPLEGHDHLGRDDPGESARLTGTAPCLLDDTHSRPGSNQADYFWATAVLRKSFGVRDGFLKNYVAFDGCSV
ncbi:hypothetical protein K0M31_018490 [Melipona bicolor]|uniref:Uncharacterized protein n=1 Tax=Melipona bicolor TaxID=60889 RepID=A0AA40G3W4_9HYME|nr:hypothetical protein K0M31_018490 [Melipona bicolor]